MQKLPPLAGHLARTLASMALALTVCACASGPTKEECVATDWRAVGYEDGVRGWPETHMAAHRKGCAKQGVTLDLNAYRGGWDEGVRHYCRAGNGYHEGRTGRRYNGVCPTGLEGAFLDAYRAGKDLYVLEAQVHRTERTLKSRRARLGQIEAAMRDAGLELVAPGVPTARRVVLLDQLRKLGDERAATRADIPSLEAALASQRQHLAAASARQDY